MCAAKRSELSKGCNYCDSLTQMLRRRCGINYQDTKKPLHYRTQPSGPRHGEAARPQRPMVANPCFPQGSLAVPHPENRAVGLTALTWQSPACKRAPPSRAADCGVTRTLPCGWDTSGMLGECAKATGQKGNQNQSTTRAKVRLSHEETVTKPSQTKSCSDVRRPR